LSFDRISPCAKFVAGVVLPIPTFGIVHPHIDFVGGLYEFVRKARATTGTEDCSVTTGTLKTCA
jgi:hypothetical protein